MLIPIHICICILGKHHEGIEQWIVTTSRGTIGYISPQSLIQTFSFDGMTVTEEKVISDTSIKVSVFFSRRQLSLLLITEGRIPTFSSSFMISLCFVKFICVFKSNSTATVMFPRTGIFNRHSSDFRHAREKSFFLFFSFPFLTTVQWNYTEIQNLAKKVERPVNYSEQKGMQLNWVRKYVPPMGKM